MAPAWLTSHASAAKAQAEEHKALLAVVGATTGVSIGAYLYRRKNRRISKPTFSQLGGGSIEAKNYQGEIEQYLEKYNTQVRGEGAEARLEGSAKVAAFVDKFYSLVTDLYEWGWGTSFHFSPALPGKGWPEAEAAHETRAGAILGLKPGLKALDVGCGVGGPMRTVAASSGAHVTGITINQYQVDRAATHNRRLGLQAQCEPVRGNFLDMPFADASFDGAYAMEATCHADKLENVYSEVFRVLKPGARFCTYEWVSTPDFDPSNRAHVAILDEIVIGNGLPTMHTWTEAEEAGAKVGFKLLESRDLARAPRDSVAPWWVDAGLAPATSGTPADAVNPWYARLSKNRTLLRISTGINGALVAFAEFLRLAPKGTSEIHTLLMATAFALVDGGEIGIFTPMHMLVFEKPLVPAAEPTPVAEPAPAAPSAAE